MRATSRRRPSLSSPFWLPAMSASLRRKSLLLENSSFIRTRGSVNKPYVARGNSLLTFPIDQSNGSLGASSTDAVPPTTLPVIAP